MVNHIKSWYFSLVAALIQVVYVIYWFSYADFSPTNPQDDLASIGAIPLFLAFTMSIVFIVLVAVTILLAVRNKKINMVVAILSLIFGIFLGIMATSPYLTMAASHFRVSIWLQTLQSLSLISAGSLYFLKKTDRQS